MVILLFLQIMNVDAQLLIIFLVIHRLNDDGTFKQLVLKSDSHLPKKIVICFIENPVKMIKNAYFIFKALFVLKIFKFLSWLFDPVGITA